MRVAEIDTLLMEKLAIILAVLVVFYRLGRIEQRLNQLTRKFAAFLDRERAAVRVAIYPYNSSKEETKMILKDTQKLPMSIAAVDAKGNPAGAFDAVPAWSVVDAALGSLVVSDDGLSAEFTPAGALGTTKVQVAALASGKSIVGELEISVVASDAVSIQIQAGAPVDV